MKYKKIIASALAVAMVLTTMVTTSLIVSAESDLTSNDNYNFINLENAEGETVDDSLKVNSASYTFNIPNVSNTVESISFMGVTENVTSIVVKITALDVAEQSSTYSYSPNVEDVNYNPNIIVNGSTSTLNFVNEISNFSGNVNISVTIATKTSLASEADAQNAVSVGDIYATASEGTVTSFALAFYEKYTEPTSEQLAINETNFPDDNFRQLILERYDNSKDGFLSTDELKADIINAAEANIKNLKGIEYFTALTKLWCNGNQLTTLDVSMNTALQELKCNDNQLTSIDLSSNTALTTLICTGNHMESVDVSNNTALKELWCGGDFYLSNLDVSKNTALVTLYCESGNITTLDLSNNTALKELWCGGNALTSLDLSNNTAITRFSCAANQFNIGNVIDSYSLTNLPQGFVASKASNWQGADYDTETNSLTNFTGNEVTYTYDCGNNNTASCKLILNNYVKSHEHNWSSDWLNNETHHWHNCMADNCDIITDSEKDGYAVHIEDEGTVTVKATEKSEGVRTYKCTVCDCIVRTEKIAKLEYTSTPSTTTPSATPETTEKAEEVVEEAVEEAKENSTVKIKIKTEDTKIKAEVFLNAKDKSVKLELTLRNGVKWVIEADNISEKAANVDIDVDLNTKNIPSKKVEEISEGNETMQISLAHNGEFGFMADIHVPVAKKHNGKIANLFHYNDGDFDFIASAKVKNAKVILPFTHASEYVVVFADEAMGEDVSSAAEIYSDSSTILDADSNSADVKVYVIALAVLAFAGFAVARKIRQK